MLPQFVENRRRDKIQWNCVNEIILKHHYKDFSFDNLSNRGNIAQRGISAMSSLGSAEFNSPDVYSELELLLLSLL